MSLFVYVALGFLFGCIPFAFLLAKTLLHVDVREYGPDHNPGALNAIRAGSWQVGVVGGILDWGKGVAPILVAQYASGLSRWSLVPVALAPVFGHAFTPLLGFRGGKAVAVSLGIWAALTRGLGFLVLGLTAGLFWAVQRADGWSITLGFVGLLAYILLFALEPYLLAIWLVNAAIILWKHRADLREPMRARAYLSFGRAR